MADTGYFSEKSIADCKQKNREPILSTAREKYNSFFTDILA